MFENPNDTALIVIDMVNDFVHPDGTLVVPGATEIVPNIKALLDEARNKDVNVIYVNDTHEPDDDEFKSWPVHSVEGTEGAKVFEDITPGAGEYVVPKTRFSGFYDTDLEQILIELGTKNLVITGVVTNICVLATTLDAIMRGYNVTIPSNSVTGLNDKHHEDALEMIEVVGGTII